jgi:hypothetical protein
MEARMRNQDVERAAPQGDVDGALEQARGALDELRTLRDSVQQRIGDNVRATEGMTPQERARMELMRELSRLQDDEVGLRSETRALHQEWRKQAEAQAIDPRVAKNLAQKAAALRKELDAINDARLGRDGRRALEDAREQLQQLEAEAGGDPARALQSYEAAQQPPARSSAPAAAPASSPASAARSTRPARRPQRLLEQLGEADPRPRRRPRRRREGPVRRRAAAPGNLRAQAQQLLDGPSASELPEPGKQALRGALEGMSGSAKRPRPAPRRHRGRPAERRDLRDPEGARQPAPELAPAGRRLARGASTETERDRSLRDELMDAMKEGAPDGYDQQVERYYEELLR